MTAIPRPFSSSAIPDQLAAPLRQVARRQWVITALVGIAKLLIVTLLAILAAALLLGYFQNLPIIPRLIIAGIAWLAVLSAAVRFLRPLLNRTNLGTAASHIERQHPGMQERLSSAIELADESNPLFRGSPALVAHLFEQARADAAAIEPARLVPNDQVIQWACLLLPVILAWAALVLIPATTHTTLSGLYRVCLPWKNSVPAILAQVGVAPGDVTLAQGDSLDVTAHLSLDFGTSQRHASLIRNQDGAQPIVDAMPASSLHNFALSLPNVQQSFAYKVSTDNGDSQWFHATVHPLPVVSSIDARCDYPAYTALPATTSNSHDGSIRAIIGTRITLTVHTAQPIQNDQSQLQMDDGTAFPLKATADGYQSQFTVSRTGSYQLKLINEFGLTNKNEQPRSIVAIVDEKPRILIRSPEQRVTVGQNDTVPVKYTASDDFAVARIEAIVQVDNQPPVTVPVDFKTADRRLVTGPPFVLDVASLLKSAGTARSQLISYRLKVWDNRDPDPQSAVSNQQTLVIDRSDSHNFQSHEQRQQAAELQRAIDHAINQLSYAQQQIQPARDANTNQGLEDWRKKQLHDAGDQLTTAAKQLAKAADDAKDSPLADVARKVEQIANKPVESAAEDAVKADLNSDDGQNRKESATRALAEIADARQQLQDLQQDRAVEKAQQQAEAAHDLIDAAQKQQEAADLMKAAAQDAQQNQQQSRQQQQRAQRDQQQASEKLQQALQQSEALRDPKAQQTAQQLEDLIHKVDDTQKQQQKAADQTQKLQAANDVQTRANDIAAQQEALNQEIQKSAEQNKDALQKANANPPTDDQQKQIVQALNQNNLQQARDQMRRSADQLHQAAQQLQNQATANDLHPDAQQQDAVNKDQQAKDQANQQQQANDQAANDLKQTAAAQTRPNADDHAVTAAKQAAEQTAKQAQDLQPTDAQAKKDADTAQADAKSAEKAADQAAQATDAQDAQKQLNQAAAELKKAGAELARAAQENGDADKTAMVKSQQKAAAAAADAAQKQADQQNDLAKAVTDPQRTLAAVQNPPQADQAAQQQKQVADQAQQAAQQADQLQQQANAANDPEMAARAQQARADLAQAQEHADQAAQQQQQAADAQHNAAAADHANDAKAAEQNAQHALAKAADQQHQAQAALAKAEGELRNLPRQDATADAQQSENDPAQASPAQQAAQAAQEAQQAQREAMQQQNAQAAQQAARALAQAAQAMARATPGMHPGPPDPGQQPGNDPADDPGNTPGNNPAKKPSQTPGHTPDSQQGITAAAAPTSVPDSVSAMGITADQWANLPPLAKKDLMNAAQQSGPPGYRQMMKDYFAKIAKLQEDGAR